MDEYDEPKWVVNTETSRSLIDDVYETLDRMYQREIARLQLLLHEKFDEVLQDAKNKLEEFATIAHPDAVEELRQVISDEIAVWVGKNESIVNSRIQDLLSALHSRKIGAMRSLGILPTNFGVSTKPNGKEGNKASRSPKAKSSPSGLPQSGTPNTGREDDSAYRE